MVWWGVWVEKGAANVKDGQVQVQEQNKQSDEKRIGTPIL